MRTEYLTSDEELTNDQLVELVQSGDAAAFGELYRRFYPRVRGKAIHMGVPYDEVDDMAQDIFVHIHEKVDRYTAGSFAGWVMTVARNYIYDEYRKQKRRSGLLGEVAYDFTTDDCTVYHETGYDEVVEEDPLPTVFARLRDEYGVTRAGVEVAVQQIVDGYPRREVADNIGLTYTTLRTRLTKFRNSLREAGFDEEAFVKEFLPHS